MLYKSSVLTLLNEFCLKFDHVCEVVGCAFKDKRGVIWHMCGVYRSSHADLTATLIQINRVLDVLKCSHPLRNVVIIGDFNVDACNATDRQYRQLQEFMLSLEVPCDSMINVIDPSVLGPTTDVGSAMDHIWTNTVPEATSIHIVYYSLHEFVAADLVPHPIA